MTAQTNAEGTLLTPYQFAGMQLQNRVVMASMTRGRARNAALVPTELHADYYRQRASAGLIVTEATWISREAIGSINVPGLFTPEQVDAWRVVTDAVHGAGGRIFAQLAHSGAVSHPDFFEGRLPLAPSAVNPGQQSFTPSGFKETVTPRAMTLDEIRRTVADYAAAARNARLAGFDGVELHAATVYLLPEFLNSGLNQREDQYGGSAENRARIVLETLEAMIAEWGAGKVGVKISPAAAMGGFNPTPETVPTYNYLVARLNDLPLSHLQLVRAPQVDLAGSPVAAIADTIGYYRARYKGVLIANGGFDGATAAAEIAQQRADLISIGAPFIGNPDLVRRLAENMPLSSSNRGTYYQGGHEGYTDYPTADRQVSIPRMIKEADMDGKNLRVVVTGYMQVAPKDRETFITVLQAHIPRVREKDGCIAYSFAVDVLDPNVVRMSEAWRDQKALDTHLAGDEFQATLKDLASVEVVSRNIQKYDVSSITDI